MTNPASFDTVIVGAGPAGASSAIQLARSGRSVALVDKARFPRDKCCGDGLTTGALRELERIGFDPRTTPSWTPIDALLVRSPSGRTARVPLGHKDGCFGAVVRRRDLDAGLVDLARSVGVSVYEGHEFVNLQTAPGTSSVVADFADGSSLQADHLIAADGAHSKVRAVVNAFAPSDNLDLQSPTRARAALDSDWIAFRTYAENVSDEAASQLWVWFEQSVLPGYVWSFPVAGGAANIGVCLMRSSTQRGSEIQAAWQRVLHHPFLNSLLGKRATVALPARAWPIPSGVNRSLLSSLDGRVLYVGDAAGTADPMTGEGIAQALHSACAVSEAIIDADKTDALSVEAIYSSAIHSILEQEQRLSRLISRMLAHPLGARAAVRFSDLNDFTRSQVGRWLYEDYPRALVTSPRSWPDVARRRPAPFTSQSD